MTVQGLDLIDRYADNLRKYLHGEGEAALEQAYDLARGALADGVGVVEMAAMHHEAMVRVLREVTSPEERERALQAASDLFVESVSPFEMTHRAFRESTLALRHLNDKLENEARRIAHALHAEAGQLLASVHIAVARISSHLPAGERWHVSQIDGLLDQISQQIRRLSHELRPTILDDLGLMPALRFLAEGVSARSSIPVSVEGSLEKRLPVAVETAIYRTVQEALNNMSRHARATRAVVQLSKEPHRVICSVRDDGTGFDPAAVMSNGGDGGLGLLGMRERLNALGGTLDIRSRRGHGAEVRITLPTED